MRALWVLLVLGACHRSPRQAPPTPPAAPDAALADAALADAAPLDGQLPPAFFKALGMSEPDRPCREDAECVVTTSAGCCQCCPCMAARAMTKKAIKEGDARCQIADCYTPDCDLLHGPACPACVPDHPAFCRQGVCVMKP